MISRTGTHALRALVHMATLPETEFVGAATLAERIGAPANYLGKLLQVLASTGLLESRKGLGGGFRLAREPRAVSLYDALDPVEDFAKWEGCFLGGVACTDETACAVHGEWAGVRERFLSFLRGTTLESVVSRAAAGPGCPASLPAGPQGTET